ncbi:MAG: hypothetical protein V5A39_09695 [Haloarculaceae archaeon]
MATIRLRDWTKEQIEEIREEESHSSHDSVIKSLLKDRQLAQFAEAEPPTEASELPPEPTEKAFDDLTVLAEMVTADNGLLFLWCPSCGNEVAHVGVENPVSMSAFEAECQRCLTRLDQHAIVAIEIGYPLEQRIVNETLESDLKRCVIDYWDRALKRTADGRLDVEATEDHFVWELDRYYREFGWDWPEAVPVVTIEPGETYRDEATGERIDVLDVESEHRNSIDAYRVRRYGGPDDGGKTDVIDANSVTSLVLGRTLYRDS